MITSDLGIPTRDFLIPAGLSGGQRGQFARQSRRVVRQQPQRTSWVADHLLSLCPLVKLSALVRRYRESPNSIQRSDKGLETRRKTRCHKWLRGQNLRQVYRRKPFFRKTTCGIFIISRTSSRL